MVIYVVRSGDSIFNIAERYGTMADNIILANKLKNPDELVVGQTIIIPIDTYTVKQGETINSIAKKLNTSFRQLTVTNNLDARESLQVGQVLTVPMPLKEAIVVNAYVDTYITQPPELDEIAEETTPYLTYLSPFSYTISKDGLLIAPNLYNLQEIAKQNNTQLILVITNIDENGFNAELGKMLLTDETVQNRILAQAVQIANEEGFSVVQFDLEFLPPETKEDYNKFLLKARDILHKNDLLLSTALAPKIRADQVGQWYEAHDYKAHGELADFVVLMTYEWGYTYGLPLPISPYAPVRDVLEYALTVIPPEKILLGQNLYGYNWREPYKKNGEAANSLSPNEAIELAGENNRSILYDEIARAPYFYYVDKDGRQHTVWFEDARSIQAKFNLIRQYNLLGISYWRLGYDFPQNFLMLDKQFDIIKLT